MVYSQGKKYMRLPFGNTFKFILMEEYNASRPASPSSRSQTPSNCASTGQSSALPREEDDDVVVMGSQPASAPLSNVSRRQMRRKPAHDKSTLSIKAVPSGSNKRKYNETEDDAVYASDNLQPKRMKQMLRVPRQAKAPSARRQKYPAHMYPYHQTYSSSQIQYAQNVYQPQRPSSSAYASEQQQKQQQHQSTAQPAQQIRAHKNDKPSPHADGAQALRNPRQALPSPQVPDIPQEWLPREPHPLLDAWLGLEGHGLQHQQDVPSTYHGQGTYHTEQAYGFQDQPYMEQQDPSQLALQSGYREPKTVHNVHQQVIEQRQSSALAFSPSNDPDQQNTTNPEVTLRNSTTRPFEFASNGPKPPTKANRPPRTSPSGAPDQSGQSNQISEVSKNDLPPNPKPYSSMDLAKQSNAAQVQVMTSKAASKRKFSFEEDGLDIGEAPSKRRKSNIQATTPDGEEDKRSQQVSSEAYNHESTFQNIEQSSNEYPSAEDPTSLEYALEYFDPLQLANVGDKELVDWFTADELRCTYTRVQLRQLFSDEYLASLGMWDIMDSPLPGGQTSQPSDAALNSELTKSRLTPPDSELDEIDRFFRESNPECGNSVGVGGDLEQNLDFVQSSTLIQTAGGGVNSGEDFSATGNAQSNSLEVAIVSNADEEEAMEEGSKKANVSEGADGDLVEQQSANFENGSSDPVGDEVANKNLQLISDHEQAWLNVLDWSNPAQEDMLFGLEFDA